MANWEQQITHERERCLRIVESYLGKFGDFRDRLALRISNMIRNGIVPETFIEQIASEEPTEYAEPLSVDEETDRCLLCVAIHYEEDAPHEVNLFLFELENKIGTGFES